MRTRDERGLGLREGLAMTTPLGLRRAAGRGRAPPNVPLNQGEREEDDVEREGECEAVEELEGEAEGCEAVADDLVQIPAMVARMPDIAIRVSTEARSKNARGERRMGASRGDSRVVFVQVDEAVLVGPS